MAETVNEPDLFEESDFATDQTENESSSAVEEATEQPTSENEATDSTADSKENANESKAGDEIDEFLAKKGVNANDPDALRKVASMYKNVEKEFYTKSQEKAQLERQLANNNNQPSGDYVNDPMARIQALEAQVAADKRVASAKAWKEAKNLTPEQEEKMVEFMQQPLLLNGQPQVDANGNQLTKGYLVTLGLLSLDDIYRTVGGDSIKADAVKQTMKQAVEKEVAARQTAKSPASLATNSTQFDKQDEDDAFAEALLGN